MRRIAVRLRILAFHALMALHLQGGDFSYGLGRSDQATLRIPRPPKVFLNLSKVSVEVVDKSGGFSDTPGLQSAIQRQLEGEFTITGVSPEAQMKVTVLAFEPPVAGSTYVVQNLQAQGAPFGMGFAQAGQVLPGQISLPPAGGAAVGQGDAQAGQAQGGTVGAGASVCAILQQSLQANSTPPQFDPSRQVLVETWEGCGRLALHVEVLGAQGKVLDAYNPEGAYRQRGVISVNGVDRVDRTQLPTPQAIFQHIGKTVIEQFRPRYAHVIEEAKVKLACDEELRQVNRLAMSNQWQTALSGWQGIQMKKYPSDRLYNMAVANEAMAYEAYLTKRDVPLMLSLFNKAITLFNEAFKLDPKEKNLQTAADRFRSAQAGVESIRVNFNRAQNVSVQLAQEELEKQKEEKRRSDELRRIAEEKEAELRALRDPRPDAPQESSFRKFARLRMAALTDEISPEEIAKLEGQGRSIYRLGESEVRRVVFQEQERWSKLYPLLTQYKESYDGFNGDNKITAEERSVLVDVAKNLELSADDVKAVESGLLPLKKN